MKKTELRELIQEYMTGMGIPCLTHETKHQIYVYIETTHYPMEFSVSTSMKEYYVRPYIEDMANMILEAGILPTPEIPASQIEEWEYLRKMGL